MRIVMHGHHAGELFSLFLDEQAVRRIAFIREHKPSDEQELRLALLQDVTDLLPRNKARVALDQSWVYNEKAWEEYLASFDVEAFHREHCHPNCPWDGKTIFARGVGVNVLDGMEAAQ